MSNEILREFELYPESTKRIVEIVRKNPICLDNCAEILEKAVEIFNECGTPMTNGAGFLDKIFEEWKGFVGI